MRVATSILILLVLAGGLFGQETTSTSPETTSTSQETTSTATSTQAAETTQAEKPAEPQYPGSYELRQQFTAVLRDSPPVLAQLLVLEPTLLADDAFLARYPDLAAFVKKYPEVRAHPRFYVAEFQPPPQRSGGIIGDILESVIIFMTFSLLAFALAWLIRTIIEQKRWNKLSTRQAEVHNKILDRFSNSTELLDYIKTPAGTKFLESAPIPLNEPRVTPKLPMTRVMWSVQLGVVMTAAALGMLLVSTRFADDTGKELFAMGVIAFSIGAGFVGSAAVSLFLSQRLGLWKLPPHDSDAPPEDRVHNPGLLK